MLKAALSRQTLSYDYSFYFSTSNNIYDSKTCLKCSLSKMTIACRVFVTHGVIVTLFLNEWSDKDLSQLLDS